MCYENHFLATFFDLSSRTINSPVDFKLSFFHHLLTLAFLMHLLTSVEDIIQSMYKQNLRTYLYLYKKVKMRSLECKVNEGNVYTALYTIFNFKLRARPENVSAHFFWKKVLFFTNSIFYQRFYYYFPFCFFSPSKFYFFACRNFEIFGLPTVKRLIKQMDHITL